MKFLQHKNTAERHARPYPKPQYADIGLVSQWEELRSHVINALSMIRPTATGIGVLFIVIFGYLYAFHEMRFYAVEMDSMAPTIQQGDCILIVDRPSYERGDIIVFNDPVTPGAYLTKRIVGVGGDTITVEGSVLHVNGEPMDEPYITERMDYSMWPFTVPMGEVFVLGDNRNASDDSYAWWRAVPVNEIRGRVLQVYFPFDRFQRVGRGEGLLAGP